MPDNETALLIMDVQEEIADRYAGGDLLERLGRAAAAARRAGVSVIYVEVEFRPGYPEISRRNRSFSRITESREFINSKVHAAIAPQPGDIEIVKKRVSAFAGSDLELVLRAREIRTLVLSGIATSGVVLSTLRAATDMDFQLIVLEDCCADNDPEVHRLLTEKIFRRQAEVLDVESWERRLFA